MGSLDTQPSSHVTLLQWTLWHGSEALTCEVNACAPHSFEVCVTPLQHDRTTITEHFTSVIGAMRRHAEIIEMLREKGWDTTDYCDPNQPRESAA